MAWSNGSLVLFDGMAVNQVNAVLTTPVSLSEGSIFSVDTATKRSGAASYRLNKSASNIYGALYTSALAGGARSALGGTLVFRIAGGWAAGEIIIINPALGGIFGLGDIGILHDTSSGEYRMVIIGTSANPEWTGSFPLTTGGAADWYAIQFSRYNPTPGTSSLRWRHGLRVLEAGSSVVQERSPWVEVNQGGIGLTTINSFGLSLAGPVGAATTETPDINIDCFAVVAGGVFGPDDIKTEVVLPDNDGTDTAWTASAGNRYQCVDDDSFTAVDDTDYVETATLNAAYTASFTNFATLSGSDEEFAVNGFYRAWVPTPSGVNRVQGRLRTGAGAVVANGATITAATPSWGFTDPAVRDTASPYAAGGSGASPLTTTIINGFEFGVQALGGTANKRCSALALQRLYGIPCSDVDPILSGLTTREDASITGNKRVPATAQEG